MTKQTDISLQRLLKRMDEWRHLPTYQLERRMDIVLSFLIPDIVRKEFDLTPDHDLEIIPEFPLHKGLIINDNDEGDNQSVKVDFALFSKQERRIFLVELKTENNSIDETQLKNMRKAKKAGANKLLNGVIKCAQNTASPRKYAHLIWMLHNVECIILPREFIRMKLADERPGLAKNLGDLKVCPNWEKNANIDLVLLYPGFEQENKTMRREKLEPLVEEFSPPIHSIDFYNVVEQFAAHAVSPTLTEWVTHEAGKVTPWPIEN